MVALRRSAWLRSLVSTPSRMAQSEADAKVF
jgi:hypothetical protein